MRSKLLYEYYSSNFVNTHQWPLLLIWLNNYQAGKVRDEITYRFPNFNGFK